MNQGSSDTEFAWRPDDEWLRTANVSRLAERLGQADHAALLAFSQREPAAFWDAVVDALGVEFETPYTEVLDVSRGIEWPRWFEDGRINIGANCVARHAAA